MAALSLVLGEAHASEFPKRLSGADRKTRLQFEWYMIMQGVFLLLACQPSVAKNEIWTLHSDHSTSETEIAPFLSGSCSRVSYVKGSNYDNNVKALQSRLVDRIDVNVRIWEEASDEYDNSETVYGVAGCLNLDVKGCKFCLRSIIRNLKAWCPPRPMTTEIVLEGCFMRYDSYYLKVPENFPSGQ